MNLYTVPVIQPDLRHEETIVQIANVFQYLELVVGEVFDKIEQRIEVNQKAVKDINRRIDRVNSKIEEFSLQDESSVQLTSTNAYPAENLFPDIPMTITLENRKLITLKQDYTIESNPDPNIPKSYDKKLKFYHVKKASRDGTAFGQTRSYDYELKDPPMDIIDSVNALLLFDRDELAYNRKSIKSSLKHYANETSHSPEMGTLKPFDYGPPPSITNRKLKNMKLKNSLFLSPKWNDSQSIEIPITLPKVLKVADTKQGKIGKPLESKLSKTAETDKSQSSTAPIETKEEISVVDSPPPPPLPPLPPPQTIDEPKKNPEKKPAPPKLTSNTQDRSSLMEAIRQAGGASKMKKRPEDEKIEIKATASATGGGNLMDDLHKKLALRRKGISGTKVDGGSGTHSSAVGGGVLEGISAMIPPPPKRRDDSSASETEDDDWN